MMPDADLRQPFERLWAPWRMTYVGGDAKRSDCVFCDLANSDEDVTNLVVARTERAFVSLNLFPYNGGHLLIVPHTHAASPIDADPEDLAELGRLLKPVLRTLQRAMNAEGFNTGINTGSAGGAGIPGHLHVHVVPRWVGDANFLPVVGWTKALPELLPATYAKLRAELSRELHGPRELSVCICNPESGTVAIRHGVHNLPVVQTETDCAMWITAVNLARQMGVATSVVGWTGEGRVGPDAAGAIVLVGKADRLTAGWRWAGATHLEAGPAQIASMALQAIQDPIR